MIFSGVIDWIECMTFVYFIKYHLCYTYLFYKVSLLLHTDTSIGTQSSPIDLTMIILVQCMNPTALAKIQMCAYQIAGWLILGKKKTCFMHQTCCKYSFVGRFFNFVTWPCVVAYLSCSFWLLNVESTSYICISWVLFTCPRRLDTQFILPQHQGWGGRYALNFAKIKRANTMKQTRPVDISQPLSQCTL